MLNPFQVQQLRERWLSSGRDPEQFEGQPVQVARMSGVKEPHPANETAATFYPPARIFGTPVEPWCLTNVLEKRPVHLSVIETRQASNARVIGFTAALDQNNVLLGPEDASPAKLGQFLERNRSNFHGYCAECINGELKVCFAGRSLPRYLNMDALFLPNLEPGNYGSFLFRQLPLMLQLKSAMPAFDCYIAGERTPWLAQAIEVVGLPAKPVFTVREICGDVFRSIWLCSGDDNEGFLRPDVREGIEATVTRTLRSRSGGHEKVYVSRALSATWRPNYRPMINEIEVEDRVRRAGFTVIYPETLSFNDQIGAFASARYILGPSGSGMLNAIFAKPGARVVDIETFTYTARQHAHLYSSSGKEYAFGFAQPDPTDEALLMFRRWRLGDGLLEEVLDWLLS
jgi:hypothetical protein